MLYSNTYPTTYEEIKTYFPVEYRNVLEYDALWQVQGRHLDSVQNAIETVILAMFIRYADEPTIARWELFLSIAYGGRRSLEDRKKMVLSYFIDNGHIGAPEIRKLLAVFTTAPVDIRLEGGNLRMDIEKRGDEVFHLSDFYYILQIKIPAHLSLANYIRTNIDNALYMGAFTIVQKQTVLNHPGDLVMEPNGHIHTQLHIGATSAGYRQAFINQPGDLKMEPNNIACGKLHMGGAVFIRRQVTVNDPAELHLEPKASRNTLHLGTVIVEKKEQTINRPEDLATEE